MGAGRKTETFYAGTPSTPARTNAWYGTYSVAARNLREDELGGVIFGCKHNTMNECLTKQLFGLPSGHISYVKNVKPGMPLFLFNYSDRKMHGIFEAACAGKLNIDQFAWSDGGRIKTQFPAQVLVSMKTQCYPVPESHFKSVISDNYHRPRHFYFELDHAQTSALISLFKPAPVHDVANKWDPSKSLQSPTTKAYLNPGPTKSEFYTKDLDPFGVSSESHCVAPYKLADPEGEYASACRTSTIHLDNESSKWDDLDDAATKEGTESVNDDHQHTNPPREEQHDTVAVRQKLQELFVLRQQEAQSSNGTVDSASDKSMPQEAQYGAALPTDPPDSTSKADASIEDLTSLGKYHGNAELLHIINELSKRTRAMEKKLVESDKEKLFLRESVKDAERKVQQLEYKFEKLQLNYNSLAPLVGGPYDNVEGPSIFILGGYRGSTCLSSLDAFCPRTDRLVPLCPMSSARAYAAAAALNNNIYIFGGGDGSTWYHSVEYYSRGENQWMTCPRLKHKKGSLAGTTLNDKIFAIGGGDGSVVFSEVEMFDPALGRWIDSLSMRQNRFAPAAAVFNGSLYVTGGYDGNISAERYDPREGFWALLPSMSVRRGSHSVAVLGEALYAVGGYDGSNRISTVEIFDSRANSWRMGSPFSIARGYGCAITMDDNLFYIGGINDAGETIDTVEVYNERQGWSVSGCQSVGGRGFACAIAV
uniref:DCD domain-containing protein n=1 Tax=Setaria italica TaxID=4555 RepID=K3XF28_SETIT